MSPSAHGSLCRALRAYLAAGGLAILAVCLAAPATAQFGRGMRAPPNVLAPAAGPSQTFSGVDFRIGTGDDDLRFDSSAWVDLIFANGRQSCRLKDWKQDTWDNNSIHEVPCTLSPPRSLSELRSARVVLNYTNDPDPNNFVTWDNWNVNSVVVSAVNAGSPATRVLCVSASPLVRMKGDLRSVDLRSFASSC